MRFLTQCNELWSLNGPVLSALLFFKHFPSWLFVHKVCIFHGGGGFVTRTAYLLNHHGLVKKLHNPALETRLTQIGVRVCSAVDISVGLYYFPNCCKTKVYWDHDFFISFNDYFCTFLNGFDILDCLFSFYCNQPLIRINCTHSYCKSISNINMHYTSPKVYLSI